MGFLQDIQAQCQVLWQEWSRGQRIAIVSAMVISLVTLVGVGYWASRPEYVPLVDRIGPVQAAEYVSALESADIAYKLNYSGSSISVARPELGEARLAVRDLLDDQPTSDSEAAGGLWADPSLNQIRMIRQQESRLARTITQMKSVRSATVHISQPEPTPFIRDVKPTKASVTLDLKAGVPFSGSDAGTIVSLVAHSVDNLTPGNVTVLSTEGRILSSSGGLEGEVSGQLEYRAMLEAELASKAENLLTPLLGFGKATVRVTADVDFTELERTQRVIDADGKAKVREEIRTEKYTDGDPLPIGPAGTSSNLTANSASSTANGKRETEDLMTEYVNGETTDMIREMPGRVRRLTVAAVVELPRPDENATAATTPPPTSVTHDQVLKIIQNAVGYDAERGDQIEVVAATLAEAPLLAPPLGFWERMNESAPVLRAMSLAIASLVAFVLGLILIKRLKPVVLESPRGSELSPEAVQRLSELSDQMRDHPEVVTTVLASWLDQQEPQSGAERKAA